MNLPAARFFPFSPVESMLEPLEPSHDDSETQAAASAAAHHNQMRILQARPLCWLPPIVVVLLLQQVVPLVAGIAVALGNSPASQARPSPTGARSSRSTART